MDAVSQGVLSRKEFMLRNYLQWNYELTAKLKEKLVINGDNVEKINKTRDDATKTATLIDRIKCKGRLKELDILADVLDETRNSFIPEWFNSWISDEIREELLAERSSLEIGDNISRECGTIVHREFGHTKRLSEVEKKTLVEILSERTQITTNVWKQRCETVKADVEVEQEVSDWADERAADIGCDTIAYIKENRPRLPEGQVNLTRKTSKAVLFGDQVPENKDLLVVLKAGICDLRGILSASLLAAETLDKDRIRVLRAIGLSDEQIAQTLLDDEIRLALQKNLKKIADADRRIAGREGEYEMLLREIITHRREHKRMMENKEKNIRVLENEVQRADNRADELGEQIKDLTKQLKIAKLELREWVDWYESIDHGKRLNDIYERDLPKLKGKLNKGTQEDTVGETKTDNQETQKKVAKPKLPSTRGKLKTVHYPPIKGKNFQLK